MEMMDGVSIYSLVVSGIFDCGADQDASVTAGNEIHVCSAYDVPDSVARHAHDREHLPFHWTGREWVRRELASPRAGTVHNRHRTILGFVRANAGHASICERYAGNCRSRGNIHTAMFGCSECSGS